MKHLNYFFGKLILICFFVSNSSSSQIVEGFEVNGFPPSGWSLEYTGTQLWSRYNSTGAYGLSNACAKFNFYSAYPPGITQSLVTPAFTTIVNGGYIKFDHAYASAFINNYIANDKLHLQISSNSGQSYTTLITLNGGDSGTLVTAPRVDNGVFIPTAAQWATKRYDLPAGTNRVKLTAQSDFGNNLYLDNIRIANPLANDIEAISVDLQRVVPPGSQIPKATFKNSGTAAQSFPVTMMITPGSYASTKTVTNLAPGASVQVSFDQWNFTTGPYNIKVYSGLSSDQDRTNDTLYRQYIPGILWQYSATADALEFSSDGQYLVSGGGANCFPFSCGQLRFWRVQDSTLLRTITTSPPSGLLGYTNDVSISPDAQKVVSAHGSVYCAPNGGCSQDRSGQFLWNFPAGTLMSGQGDSLNGNVYTIDFSPDGQLIATGRGYNNVGEIRIYNSTNFTLVRTLSGHYLETDRVRFSPNGQLLASVGYDGNLKIWNVSTGALLRTLLHGSYSQGGLPVSLAFSANGEFIATSGYGSNTVVKVWHVSDGALIHTLAGGLLIDDDAPNFTVAFSPNGLYVAATVLYTEGSVSKGLIRFWNTTTGQVVHEFVDENIGGGNNLSRTVIHSFAFSTAGNLFAYSVGNMLKVTMSDLNLANPLTNVIPTGNLIPKEYTLYQNYPNPFNPTTAISFALPKESKVTLRIYDALGKEVAVLINNEIRNAGMYKVDFVGNDFASGIYYFKLETENFVDSKRMILLK